MDNDTDIYEKYLKLIKYNLGKQLLDQKYIYEDQIGIGAFGCVLCGYRLSDHRSVAIKVLPNDQISDWYYSKTLQISIPMEVLLMSLTSNIDGVISILEYYQDPNESKWYIVMERFSKSVDLFEFICEMGFLSESLACFIFHQLTLTIIDCHLRGVLHRDIKEENIMIDTETKKIWLIDFGSGGIMNDDNHYSYKGTMSYASPEWIADHHYRGCQLESWGLGILLYTMVCGSIPFDDEKQILKSKVNFPRNLSNNCKDLILKCLERDPKLRIQPYDMITHPWVISNLNNYDSRHGSFDESFSGNKFEMRRCSCSCGDATSLFKEEQIQTKSVIETVEYSSDSDMVRNSESRTSNNTRSLPANIKKKKKISLPSCFFRLSSKSPKFNYKSTSDINTRIISHKLSRIFSKKDYGYEEDIDDNYENDDESIVLSNEYFP